MPSPMKKTGKNPDLWNQMSRSIVGCGEEGSGEGTGRKGCEPSGDVWGRHSL